MEFLALNFRFKFVCSFPDFKNEFVFFASDFHEALAVLTFYTTCSSCRVYDRFSGVSLYSEPIILDELRRRTGSSFDCSASIEEKL